MFLGCLLYSRQCSKRLTCIISLNHYNSPKKYCFHCTEEETEAQKTNYSPQGEATVSGLEHRHQPPESGFITSRLCDLPI